MDTNRFAGAAALTRLSAGAGDVRSGRQKHYEILRRCVYQAPTTPYAVPAHRPATCSFARCLMCFRSYLPEKWAADLRYLLWLRVYMQAGAPLGRSECAAELPDRPPLQLRRII